MGASRQRRVWRRSFLTLLGATLGTGLIRPLIGLAANFPFPRCAFAQRNLSAAMRSALGTAHVAAGPITLIAPERVANGAVVPLTFQSHVEDIVRFHIFVANNPTPYVARLHMLGITQPKAELRIKMAQSSPVHVVAETASGQLFRESKEIQVGISGYPG